MLTSAAFFVVEVCLPGEQHLHCHQLLLRVEGGLMDAVVLRPQPVQSELVGRRTQGCDVGPGQRTTDPPKTQRCKCNPFPEKTEDSRISEKMYHWVVLTVFAISGVGSPAFATSVSFCSSALSLLIYCYC